MTRKQTSAKVSKLAAKYLAMPREEMMAMMEEPEGRLVLRQIILAFAGSCLSQDEVKGAKVTDLTAKPLAALSTSDLKRKRKP